MNVSVRLYGPRTGSAATPLLSGRSFDVSAIEAEFTSVLAGGFGELTVKAPAEFQGVPPASLLEIRSDIRPYAHVVLRVGGQIAWEGMLVEPLLDGVNVIGFRAEGYGISLNHRAFAGVAGQALDVLSAAIRDTAPFLTFDAPSKVADPGFRLEASQTQRLAFNDIVSSINKNGSLQGWPVRCQVWEEGKVVIIANVPPDTADWQIPPDAGLRLSNPKLHDLVGSVTVVSDGNITTVTDPTFEGRYGVLREREIDIGAGAGAEQRSAFGKAYLAAHSTMRIPGTWTTTDEWVLTPSGAMLPPERVRAGDWVAVPGVGIQQVTRTKMVYPQRQLTIEFGALGEEAAWAARQQEVEAGAIRRLAPTSWLRR